VHGSNALGPMRSGNLPAFSDAGAAQAFAQRRGGQVLAYAQVDAQIVASLAPAGSHQHAEIDKKP
ncbi:MAG: nitrous oxide reductase accessory protein NosL, partial [Burkholderiales bacterium]|nr:nitrous oxide reductase accessory protein NosL [Burkholderiales bacterium]